MIGLKSRNLSDTFPCEILTPTCCKEVLNKSLCIFLNEASSRTADLYPPKMIQSLLAVVEVDKSTEIWGLVHNCC